MFTDSLYSQLVGLHGFVAHRTVSASGSSPFGTVATLSVLLGRPGQGGLFVAASRLAAARPVSVEFPTLEVDGRRGTCARRPAR